ncbi:hypothetical protein B0H17DRAFT_1136597 [Mycena rosella]|uniref:Microbial-type PARG catalytic domain-containing protein n=1 Tax=Mycena rosella TaxID=1033263 RepID=A0AAD7DAT3_MYCRO|nr:hypothetical protein B0H17DRAFT_1136597 [Mycena rosella]
MYDLSSRTSESKLQTAYYAPDSLLSTWHLSVPHTINTAIEILETTTLDAARTAALKGRKRPIGVLNFASAEQPGGGFINGSNAQEESLARSSTLYASLMTLTAQQFYSLHSAHGNGGFYTHAMIDVLTSPAVHAGLARRRARSGDSVEANIVRTMRERMARVLFLFERRGVRNLILGSFGTGVFQNDVDAVAAIWAELLADRFARSFQFVAFAVMDHPTYQRFSRAFEKAKGGSTL